MSAPTFPRLHPDAVRFVPFFVGLNFLNSIHVVFFTAWLASVGFDPYATGLLLASMNVLRVFTGPLLGIAADAFHARRLFLIGMMTVAGLCYVGYATVEGMVAVIVFSLIASAAFSAIAALIEGLSMSAATAHGFDYGRVRLTGSAAFVVMNFIGGAAVAAYGIDAFLPILIGSAVLAAVGGLALPRDEQPEVRAGFRATGRDAWQLIRQPLFVLMIAATGIAQASHTFYYGFGTLNWQKIGYSADLIGGLWALGVIAEIAVLMYSGWIVQRVGIVNLMMLGALAGIVRWTLLALSPPLIVVLFAQLLHAGTFCAVHLGMMHFMLRATPAHLVGTAQSLYFAVMIGVFFSVGQYASGALFASVQSYGYLLMAGFSAVALVLSYWLGRLWDGGELPMAARRWTKSGAWPNLDCRPQLETHPMGYHHLALATRNMKAIDHFYREVMGFDLKKVEVGPTPDGGWAKHFFYEIEPDRFIAFWELHGPNYDGKNFETGLSKAVGLPQWVNHISFYSPTEEHLRAKRDMWLAGGFDVMEIDHNWCRSIYTNDPNGTMVEYCVTTGVFTAADREEAIKAVTSDDVARSRPPKSIQMHKAADYRRAAE